MSVHIPKVMHRPLAQAWGSASPYSALTGRLPTKSNILAREQDQAWIGGILGFVERL
jgi:hypothetical protein